jgi:hypothetical protein
MKSLIPRSELTAVSERAVKNIDLFCWELFSDEIRKNNEDKSFWHGYAHGRRYLKLPNLENKITLEGGFFDLRNPIAVTPSRIVIPLSSGC